MKESNMENDPLLVLYELKKELSAFMRPEVLKKATELLEHLKDGSNVDKYEYFMKHSKFKEDCRYTQLAKEFFIKDDEPRAKELVRWLYKNWAS